MLLAAFLLSSFSDHSVTDLKDGFVRVKTPSYSVEIPKGWEVGQETSFGQREFMTRDGKFTAMTAPGGGKQGWERLYRTSLYFIKRGNPDLKETPYKISKTKQGYEAASFSMVDKKGFATERFVILKAANDNILALSVKIPSQAQEKDLAKAFDRLVKSATLVK